MKQALYFQSEEEFQSFCSQLFHAEFPMFQSVEGAGGDGGMDGKDGTRIFQMFIPDLKNRNDKTYIEKIDASLTRLRETVERERLAVSEWIFVTPEDLRYKSIIHLQRKSTEVGFGCLSWGATKLTELLNAHPAIRNSFPRIFLPDVKEGLEEVREKIDNLTRPSRHEFRIISDREFMELNNEIERKFQQDSRNAQFRFGASSAAEYAANIFRQEVNRAKEQLRRQKELSDRMYELDLQEIEEKFTKMSQQKTDEMAERGILTSGFLLQSMREIQTQKNREVERLKIRYGKE